MTSLWRAIAFLGVGLFAASFFLPLDFYNSPMERFLWALDAAFPFVNWVESLAFIGVCCAIAYPYLWAFIAGLTLLFGVHMSIKFACRSHLFCHLFGGIPITALGILLLILGDTFPPRAVQWVAAIVPSALLLILLVISSFFQPSRRIPALIILSIIIFVPLQFILAYQVLLDGGEWWGFFLGALGGIIGLVGSIGLFVRS